MSYTEILAELPRLTQSQRREIAERASWRIGMFQTCSVEIAIFNASQHMSNHFNMLLRPL